MIDRLKPGLKLGLVGAGSRLSKRSISKLDTVVNYLEVGRFMRLRGFRFGPFVSRREELWQLVAQGLHDRRVLYLEFGVYAGESIRFWSQLLRHPDARLDGFDTFEGLPEDWRLDRPKGTFSTGGVLPKVDDNRIRFFKGLFDDTLSIYQPPEHDQLIVHLDADLYRSTIGPLRCLRPLILPGTYLIFDEFADHHNEMKAFDEFLDEVSMKFVLVGSDRSLYHVAFQRTE